MSEKSFLHRWSERKTISEVAKEDPADVAAPLQQHLPQPDPDAPTLDAPAELSAAELEALPPIDSLTVGSDIRAFLRPGVPKALKNAAMRKMWLLTPAIRDHKDIAVDYAWDWNTPGGVPGDGGPLDPARVAEWVRQIRGGAPATADRSTPEPASPPKSVPASEIASEIGAAEQVAPSVPTEKPAQNIKEIAQETAASDDAPLPRPRQGSARPI